MTDKQIIIDGVDVSECEYCLKMTKYRCTIQRNVYKCLCEENPNCYYKQLKHKEKECEELKEDRERWKSNFNGKVSAIEELLHQLDQLKAENEELKKKIKYMEEYIKTVENSRNEFEKESKFLKEENAEIRKHNILQKTSEYKGEYNERIRKDRSSKHAI